ncbi:hypothetical protein GCM10023231_00520 [Olivibacter ginsenosidimutans]|uniref:Signal transduction histidine kinase internal region domain-containing protein n=1 Tax=Olivibacter ginsenosidimutans TaxID=1176537 RepID=A0ABP9ADM9_9SPHI
MAKRLPELSGRMVMGHVVGWTCYGIAMYVYNVNNYPNASVGRIVFLVLLMAMAFYAELTCFFCLFHRWKVIKMLCAAILLLVMLPLLAYYLVYAWMPKMGIQLYVEEVPFTYRQFCYNACRVLKEMGKYAGIYWVCYKLFKAKKVFRKGRQQVNELWRRVKNYQHQEIKGMVAPHFLMNAFHRCYLYVRVVNHVAAERLLYLSEALNYTLDDYNTAGLRSVTLKSELEHVHQLAYAYYGRDIHASPISCFCFGAIKGFRVPSFTLITCFENMVKYGIRNPKKQGSVIRIGANRDTLVITGVNRISVNQEHTVGKGMGLKNLGKRLNHQYNQQAKLLHWEEEGIFVFLLIVNVN